MVIAFLSIYLGGLLVLATVSIFMYFDSWYADDMRGATLLMRFAFIWPVGILLLVVQILIGVRSKDVR